MSGISRNTLRLIGTAKYPRTMKLTTNGLNNSLALLKPQYCNYGSTQGKQMSSIFESTLLDAKEKVLSLFASINKVTVETEEVKEAETGLLKVSLSGGKVELIAPYKTEGLILHPTFNMQLNGESIEPECDKTTDPDAKTSFYYHKWHISRDGDKLIFRVRDSDETFVVKHAVHIIAHEKPFIHGENGDFNVTSGKIIFDNSTFAAKMISKSDSSEVLERSFEPIDGLYWPFPRDKITDRPNKIGKMKLKFPMTASLEGARQVIKMGDSDDYCTVYHTVDVQAYKTLPENGNNNVKTKDTSKIDKLLIKLKSGDLVIGPIAPGHQRIFIRQDAGIRIDLTNKVPFIQFSPTVETGESLD